MSISTIVLKTVTEYDMIEKGDKVLAAVSGGADSVCMLHILNRLKNDLGFSLACAHVNHGLRGEAADKDESFVKDLCEREGIPFYSQRFDVAAIAAERKLTVEEAGRYVRYKFFDELRQKYGFDKIATAHNKNDNAETVLMRIIRGTGIDGLSGIDYVRGDGVIRPVLDVSRKEIEEYCKVYSLSYCTDATNADNDYTRNKIRNQLIPYIEKEFNSAVTDSLVRLSANADEDSHFLKGYAKRLFERLGSPLPNRKPNCLHIESLRMLDKSIATRVVKLAAERSCKDVKLERCHMESIFELLDKPTGASIDLPQKLRAEIAYGWLTFLGPEDEKKILENDDFFAEISVGESVFIDSLGKSISIREESVPYQCRPNEIAADLDKIGNKLLFLRSRREGDKIVFFADGRTKKIKKIFIDDKIPQKDRNKIPLLATGDEIIAIAGSRVNEKYKITKDTERMLVIEYGTFSEE